MSGTNLLTEAADFIGSAIKEGGQIIDSIGNYFKKPSKFTPSDPGFADTMAQYTSPQVAKQLADIMRNIPDGRRTKPPSYYDYLQYPHRQSYDAYHLRIGDCCFVLPPEFISVKTLSSTDSKVGLRQDSSIKTKHGYSKKEIVVTMYLNGIDQINGHKVESPMSYPYYVDGLRPLIAQFKSTPFLPIENEFINETNGIYAVALSSMIVSLVPGFTECVQVNLIMQEFNAAPYIENANIYYDDYIDWDMFRFYYQQMLREDSNLSSRLIPVPTNKSLTGNFNFLTLKSDALTTEGKDIFAYDSFDKVLSNEDGIDIADMSFTLSNILPVIQLSDHATPTHQYLGGMDTIFSITIETTNKEIASKLTNMNTMTQLMVRKNKDFNGLGFIKIDNELVNLTGTQFLMIDSLVVNTVPEFPDLISITMECISFDSTQSGKEKLKGMRPFSGNAEGTNADALSQTVTGVLNKIKQDTIIEKKLMEMELYPDLHLPLYSEVNEAIKNIRSFRDKHALSQISYTEYPKSLGEVPGKGPNGNYSKYMEPDFYVFYPMKYSDIEDSTFDIMKTPKPPKASAHVIPNIDYGDGLPEGAKVDKDGKITWFDSFKKALGIGGKSSSGNATGTVKEFIDLANSKIGCKYVWGAWGEDGGKSFDCSGFVSWLLIQIGVFNAGRREVCSGLYTACTPISKSELQTGDLCFRGPGEHVAIWLSDNKTVEAMGKDYGVCNGRVGNRFTHYGRIKGLSSKPNSNSNVASVSAATTSIESAVGVGARVGSAVASTGGITAATLDNALGGVLKGHGRDFIQFGQEFGVDPVLIAAIVTQESGHGTSKAIRNDNNPGGIMDWNNNWKTVKHFSSLNEGIRFTFKNIKNEYINKGLKTIAEIGSKYCPIGAANDPNGLNKFWVPNVSEFYRKIAGGEYCGPDATSTEDYDTTSTYQYPSLKGAGKKVCYKTGNIELNELGKPIYLESPVMEAKEGLFGDYVERQKAFQPDAKDTFASMTVDMVNYSKRGNMARAFPSYLLLICDDGGEWLDAKKLWSNFYVYKSVIDISVFQESSQPAHTATLKVTNVYSNLTKAPKAKSIKKMILDDPEYNIIQHGWYKLTGSLLGSPKLTNSMVKMKNELFDNINMKTGTRIHLRMGYGSNPCMMPICFNGTIAEMDVGDVITLVAQSDGVELINNVISTDEKETNKLTKLQSEPSDIVASLLTDRYSFWENALFKDWGEKSKYGIEHFGFFMGDQIHKHLEYDTCKNVYYGKYDCRPFCQNTFTFADGEENLNFFMFNKTPWDALQITAQFLPEFVCQPMYHQFESRLFYGLPVWSAKYKYDFGDDGKVYEYAKAFSQFHYIDSLCDIIDNQIKVSSEDLITNMVGTYSLGGKLTSTPVIYSDRSIDWASQKTKNIDTTATQDYVGWDWLYEHLPGLSLDVGKQAAIKIVISNIIDSWNKTYLNPLIILGDATIKPCDYLFINDSYTNMRGMCTVREVVHTMSVETGFVSSITPSLIATNNMAYSGMSNVLKTCMSFGAATASVMGIRHLGIQSIFKLGNILGINKTLNALEKTGTFFKGAKDIGGIAYDAVKTGRMIKDFSAVTSDMKAAVTVAKTAANAKKIGALVDGIKTAMIVAGSEFPLVGNVVMWLVSEVIFDVILGAVLDEFQWDNVISLTPLMHKGQPFVSGCKGYQNLIPGFKDSDNKSTLE